MFAPQIIVGTMTFGANLTFPQGIWQLRQIDIQNEHPKYQKASFFASAVGYSGGSSDRHWTPQNTLQGTQKTMLFDILGVILDVKNELFSQLPYSLGKSYVCTKKYRRDDDFWCEPHFSPGNMAVAAN